ncbi:hypothetical protein ERJ75_000400900 [Trypanosoma vivax]|nr:hypothetical protein ERJ75_000400900 [Trypanosoma vivax]
MPWKRVTSDKPVVLGDANRPRDVIARLRAVSSPPRACRRCSCPCAAARSRAAPCHVARVGRTGARATVRAAVTLCAQSAVQRPCALSGATRHAQARRLRTRKTCVHVPCVRQLRTASRAARGQREPPPERHLHRQLSAETPAAQWRVDDTRRRSDRRVLAPLWDDGSRPVCRATTAGRAASSARGPRRLRATPTQRRRAASATPTAENGQLWGRTVRNAVGATPSAASKAASAKGKQQQQATSMRKCKGTGPMQQHKADADGTRRAGVTQARRTGREEEVCPAMLRDTEGRGG